MERARIATADILGYPAERLAMLTGADISTARRWKRSGSLPEPALRLLHIILLGELRLLGWPGWKIIARQLVSPESWTYSPGEVLALTLLRSQLADAQSEIRRFKGIEEQPTLTGAEIDEHHSAIR